MNKFWEHHFDIFNNRRLEYGCQAALILRRIEDTSRACRMSLWVEGFRSSNIRVDLTTFHHYLKRTSEVLQLRRSELFKTSPKISILLLFIPILLLNRLVDVYFRSRGESTQPLHSLSHEVFVKLLERNDFGYIRTDSIGVVSTQEREMEIPLRLIIKLKFSHLFAALLQRKPGFI